jgi:superfamily II DNA or RNA helicase
MAKEGFDWIWCDHALTVGYRSSLTEIVQIIGRATRDAPGKTRARFTNLIAEPDASEEAGQTARVVPRSTFCCERSGRAHKGRDNYRYYVCKSARQNGWSSCPTKSVPARMIEDSVLDQLRTTLGDCGTREQLNVPEALWQSFEEDQIASSYAHW